MASIWEKAIWILAGNLNSGHSYFITAVCEAVLRNTGLQLCDLSMCTLYVFWDKFKVEQIKLPRHF